MSKLNLSIPTPCHENWDTMKPGDKGRFCASCQKTVFDFTKASDREIVTAFQKDNNLCGRFLNSQLNRDLVCPEKKNPIWLATVTAFISFIGLGTHATLAQSNIKIEQTDKRFIGLTPISKTKIKIVGKIFDNDEGDKLADVLIQIKNKDNVIYSDEKGCFEVNTEIGDVLIFSKKGYITKEVTIKSVIGYLNVEMMPNNNLTIKRPVFVVGDISAITYTKKRSFFGRIFHRIGNLFR